MVTSTATPPLATSQLRDVAIILAPSWTFCILCSAPGGKSAIELSSGMMSASGQDSGLAESAVQPATSRADRNAVARVARVAKAIRVTPIISPWPEGSGCNNVRPNARAGSGSDSIRRPIAAQAFAARAGPNHGGLYRRSRRGTQGLYRRIRYRRGGVLQGHRRRHRELELSAAHRFGHLHPDALRKARGPGRFAVFPVADGASCGEGHPLPDPYSRPRRGRAAPAERQAGGDGEFPRRHVAPAYPADALRRAGPRVGETTSGGKRFRPAAGERSLARRLGTALRRLRRARRRGEARPRRGARPRDRGPARFVARRIAAGRHPCRSLSRQRLLPRRQGLRADRFLFRLQRFLRLRFGDLPERLVLRARWQLQRHQGEADARAVPRRPPAQEGGDRSIAGAGARRRASLPADPTL